MKVFNEEVNCCQDCPFLNHIGMDGEDSYCNKLHKDITERSIDKECPFNKPITKEVIEGFGFEIFNYRNIECFNLKNYLLFKFENNNFISIDKFPGIPRHCESGNNCFRGTINNLIELEFILKSIGVIE